MSFAAITEALFYDSSLGNHFAVRPSFPGINPVIPTFSYTA